MCKKCSTDILRNIFCNNKKSPADYIYEWAKAVDAEIKHLSNDVTTLTELVTGEPIDLETLLATKADAEHTHLIEDVNDLQNTLDTKMDVYPDSANKISIYLGLDEGVPHIAVYSGSEEFTDGTLGIHFAEISVYEGEYEQGELAILSGTGILSVISKRVNPTTSLLIQEISYGDITVSRNITKPWHGDPIYGDWELKYLDLTAPVRGSYNRITSGAVYNATNKPQIIVPITLQKLANGKFGLGHQDTSGDVVGQLLDFLDSSPKQNQLYFCKAHIIDYGGEPGLGYDHYGLISYVNNSGTITITIDLGGGKQAKAVGLEVTDNTYEWQDYMSFDDISDFLKDDSADEE